MSKGADFMRGSADLPDPESESAADQRGTTAPTNESGEHSIAGGPRAEGAGSGRIVMGSELRPPAKARRKQSSGSIGNPFKAIRICTSWTQARAADHFGISERTWRDLEKSTGEEPDTVKLWDAVRDFAAELMEKRRAG